MNYKDFMIYFEGRIKRAYPDPISGAEPWTIGIGHTGSDVFKTSVWTDTQIDTAFDKDVQKVESSLNKSLTWWKTLSEPRQWVLKSMCFQIGISGLLKFTRTLEAVKDGRYADAAEGMRASLWAHQTPLRASKHAKQMETGEVVV